MIHTEQKLLTLINELGIKAENYQVFLNKIIDLIQTEIALDGVWVYLPKINLDQILENKKVTIATKLKLELEVDKSLTHQKINAKKSVVMELNQLSKYAIGLDKEEGSSLTESEGSKKLSQSISSRHLACYFKNKKIKNQAWLIFEIPYFNSTGVLIFHKSEPAGQLQVFNAKEVGVLKRLTNSIVYEVETMRLKRYKKDNRKLIELFRKTKKTETQMKLPVEVISKQSFYGELITIFKQFNLNTYLEKNYENNFTLADFQQAHKITTTQIEKLQTMIGEENDESSYMVFSGHQLILQDQEYTGKIEERINAGIKPPQAIIEVTQKYIELFSNSEMLSLREKVLDIKDIGYRLIQNLFTENAKAESLKDKVVFTNRIYPSEFLQYYYQGVKGVIVVGRMNSSNYITFHTKIIAQSLNMGFVFLHDQDRVFLSRKRRPERVLVKHNEQKMLLDPSQGLIDNFKQKNEKAETKTSSNEPYRPILTKDGTKVDVYANINLMVEINKVASLNLKGVGLFRSEMFYMLHNYFPNEEIQFDYYSTLHSRLAGRQLTIRTLDLGDDKVLSYYPEITKENSVLGMRAVRFSLRFQEIFKTQIRALLRMAGNCSEKSPPNITIPFIYSVDEIIKVKKIFAECLKELQKKGLVTQSHYKLGIMIELPSTLFILPELADHVDYFSIGTNDLCRYLLAVDDNDSNVRDMHTYSHPAFLRAMKQIMDVAKKKKIPVNQCGVLGWDDRYLSFLLGIGLRNFSITPVAVPEFIKAVEKIDVKQAKIDSEKILNYSTIEEVKSFLK